MKNLFAVVVFALLALCGCSAQTSYISGVANGVTPYQNIYAMTPIPYGWVRVCTLPVTSVYGSPCTPVANVTDQYGNPLSIIGGNFGQLKTDVVGGYTFGCSIGNLEIQVAPTNSNTPQKQFNITCPVSNVTVSVASNGLYNAPPGSIQTGNGTYQTAYTYSVPGNLMSTTGGVYAECYVTFPPTGALVAFTFGGNTVDVGIPSGAGGNAVVNLHIYNNGATNSQWFHFDSLYNYTVVGAPPAYYANSGSGTWSVDTTTSQSLVCQVQVASSSQWTPQGFLIQSAQQ